MAIAYVQEFLIVDGDTSTKNYDASAQSSTSTRSPRD